MTWLTDNDSTNDFSQSEKPTSCYEQKVGPTQQQIDEVAQKLAAQRLAKASQDTQDEAARTAAKCTSTDCARSREQKKAALQTQLAGLSPAQRIALWPGEQEGPRFLAFTPWGEESVVICSDGLTGTTDDGSIVTLVSVLL